MNFKELLIEYEEKLIVSCFSLDTKVKYYDRFLDKNFCDILGEITYGINNYTDDKYINWLLTNYDYIYGLNYRSHEVKKLSKLRVFKD